MRRLAGCLLTVLWLAGCAGSVPRPELIRAALERADAPSALTELERWSRPDDLLWLMERGTLLRAAGRLEESNRMFLQARDRQQELFTHSVSNEAAALAWNDRVRPYRAASFEVPFLYVYPILNYLELGDLEDALVEARALSEELEQRRDHGSQLSGDWALGRLLAGMVFESAGEWNEAWVSYCAADTAASARSFDPDLQAWLRQAIHRTAVATGLEAGDVTPPPARVVLWAEEGFAPVREEFRVRVPILRDEADWGGDQVPVWSDRLGRRAFEIRRTGRQWRPEEVSTWLAIALPTMPEVAAPPAAPPRLHGALGETTPLWSAEDVDAAARRDFEDSWSGIAARTAARVLVKWLASRTAERSGGKWSGRLVNWIGAAAERADLRSWSTLPSRIHLRVLEVASGEIELNLEDADGQRCTGSFAIPAGGWHFLGCRFY